MVRTCALAFLLMGLACKGLAFQVAVPEHAGPTVAYAAQELSGWTGRLTGTAPAIVTNSAPKAGVLVTLDPKLGDDEFRLVAKDGLYTVSGGKRGVIYGVYETLERFGGIDFLASWHTYVPKNGRLRVPRELDERQAPAYLYRNLYNVDVNNDVKFAVRLRCNANGHLDLTPYGGSPWHFPSGAGQCHTFWRIVPLKQYAKTHPEYFCEIDGVRQTGDYSQLCLTNPDVLEIAKKWVRAKLAAEPQSTHVGVSHNDHASNYCRCRNCAAVDAEEGSHAGTVVRFVNAVAEAVEKEFPHVIIETLACQYSRTPPRKTRLRHNVIPCLCTIELDFSRPIRESPCPENRQFLRDIAGWSAQTDRLYLWDYVTDFHHYGLPFANVYSLETVGCGPRFLSSSVEGSAIRVRFTDVGGGLVAKGSDEGIVAPCFVAGAGGKFVRGTGRIEGSTLVISSPEVPNPVRACYGWAANPLGLNLYNREGLPASPFMTR